MYFYEKNSFLSVILARYARLHVLEPMDMELTKWGTHVPGCCRLHDGATTCTSSMVADRSNEQVLKLCTCHVYVPIDYRILNLVLTQHVNLVLTQYASQLPLLGTFGHC